MATMDLEPIPTEPTNDPEPPAAAYAVTSSSLASGSPAAGRGRGSAARWAAIALALVLTFSVGIGVGRLGLPALDSAGTSAPAPAGTTGPTDFGLIREAWDVLHSKYVGADQLDDTALIYGAIYGMTDAVGDTGHTVFLTPAERAQRTNDLSGKYVGIGVRIDVAADGLPLVVGVFRDSPADGAGLHAGDIMVAVDGRSTTGADLDTVISWVRGEAGSTVVLTVKAGADAPERELRIVRADVHIQPVSWTMVAGSHTAVVRLEQFSKGASDALVEALKAARAAGADRLVLDLRGNPGGYVGEAVAVASQFLASGNVFVERDAKGEEKPTPVSPGGVATDLPLVVLVDHGTASAAEIVAGAIQDAGRGTVVGVTTFGTGTVLGEFPLSDGSALRIGTVEWLTPKGRVIWHAGITPDVSVERAETITPMIPDDLRAMSAAQVGQLGDPQLKKALELVATAS
jgi:carboxyl-terminal processing protease